MANGDAKKRKKRKEKKDRYMPPLPARCEIYVHVSVSIFYEFALILSVHMPKSLINVMFAVPETGRDRGRNLTVSRSWTRQEDMYDVCRCCWFFLNTRVYTRITAHSHARTHAHTHTDTHARTHTHTDTHTRTHVHKREGRQTERQTETVG